MWKVTSLDEPIARAAVKMIETILTVFHEFQFFWTKWQKLSSCLREFVIFWNRWSKKIFILIKYNAVFTWPSYWKTLTRKKHEAIMINPFNIGQVFFRAFVCTWINFFLDRCQINWIDNRCVVVVWTEFQVIQVLKHLELGESVWTLDLGQQSPIFGLQTASG